MSIFKKLDRTKKSFIYAKFNKIIYINDICFHKYIFVLNLRFVDDFNIKKTLLPHYLVKQSAFFNDDGNVVAKIHINVKYVFVVKVFFLH